LIDIDLNLLGAKEVSEILSEDHERYHHVGDPVFTAKHYIKIADLILQKRLEACGVDLSIARHLKIASSALPEPTPEQAAKLEMLNSVTLGFCKLFAADNPKFKEFTFIAAANRDIHTEEGDEKL